MAPGHQGEIWWPSQIAFSECDAGFEKEIDMAKQRYLTVAMRFDESEERPAFIDDLFDRLMEFPGSRDGVEVFAAGWNNLFEENRKLEEKIEKLERRLA